MSTEDKVWDSVSDSVYASIEDLSTKSIALSIRISTWGSLYVFALSSVKNSVGSSVETFLGNYEYWEKSLSPHLAFCLAWCFQIPTAFRFRLRLGFRLESSSAFRSNLYEWLWIQEIKFRQLLNQYRPCYAWILSAMIYGTPFKMPYTLCHTQGHLFSTELLTSLNT